MNAPCSRIRLLLAAACFTAVAMAPAAPQALPDPYRLDAAPRLEDHRGLALPSRTVTLSAPVDGTLSAVLVPEGASVTAGQRIAQMDDAVQAAVVETARVRMDSQAGIQRAAAELKAAAAELERVRSSHERNAASALEVLRTEARFDAATADLAQARENHAIDTWTLRLEQARLDEYALRSPFDGVVVMHEVEPGTSIAQSAPVVTLAKLDTLEAELHLPVTLGLPAVGRRYTLVAGAPIGREVTATLSFVSPVIDPASRTFRCKFTIANDDLSLPAGFDVHLRTLEPLSDDAVSVAE